MVWTRFADFLLGARPGLRPRRLPDARTADAPRPAGPRALTSQLPRFKGEASDLDRPARSSLAPVDQQRARLQRAFTPSQPVNDVRMFAGRRELLLSLIRAIEERPARSVFGDRGIGKTSRPPRLRAAGARGALHRALRVVHRDERV
ncbi:hypothetical protein AB5I41_19930 [Sphingomonas sp. MMS24-JH45]